MSRDQLLAEILKLPPEERAELVMQVNDTLADETWDPDMTPELSAELDRRMKLADEDPTRGIPLEQSRARIESRLREIQKRHQPTGAPRGERNRRSRG